MVTNLYTVRDVPAQQYSPPFPARNAAVATRVMREMLKNVPTHLLPEYELYQVGSFCDASGTVESAVPSAWRHPTRLSPLSRISLRSESRTHRGPYLWRLSWVFTMPLAALSQGRTAFDISEASILMPTSAGLLL